MSGRLGVEGNNRDIRSTFGCCSVVVEPRSLVPPLAKLSRYTLYLAVSQLLTFPTRDEHGRGARHERAHRGKSIESWSGPSLRSSENGPATGAR